MVVRREKAPRPVAKRAPAKAKKKPPVTGAATGAPAAGAPKAKDLRLPVHLKTVETDIRKYTFLIYGREGVGKTSAFASFPEALFLCTEPGGKGLEIYMFNEPYGIRDWADMRAAVDLLVATPGRFENVIIDTADRAYDMCLDWVCKERRIEYPGQDAFGEQDYGKSWRAVKQEFVVAIDRIWKTGRGIGFVSHKKEETIKARSGNSTYTSIVPSMSNQARKVVEALTDYAFYADYAYINNESKRVLVTQGDEMVWAKARKGAAGRFPRFMELPDPGDPNTESPYEAILRGFHGQHPGIKIEDLGLSRAGSEAFGTFVTKEKAKKKVAGLPAGKVAGLPAKKGGAARRAK